MIDLAKTFFFSAINLTTSGGELGPILMKVGHTIRRS